MITRLSMAILMEHDLDAAVDFYKNLGLTLNFHMKGQWAEFALEGGIKFGLCPISEKVGDIRTGLVFEVDDVRKLYEDQQGAIDFMAEPLEKTHGIMLSVKDPGGNIIDLYQPTPEKIQEIIDKAKQEGCCEKGACKCGKSA